MNFNILHIKCLEFITILKGRKAYKGFVVGTPIIVIDMKTKYIVMYTSN